MSQTPDSVAPRTDLSPGFVSDLLWGSSVLLVARLDQAGRVLLASPALRAAVPGPIVGTVLALPSPSPSGRDWQVSDVDLELDRSGPRPYRVWWRAEPEGSLWIAEPRDPLAIRLAALASAHAALQAEHDTLIRQAQDLETAAHLDPLTGVGNRRAMERALRGALEDSRVSRGTSLIMIDLDLFKQINDSHGHLAGDAALAAIGALLTRLCRESDTVTRYGGEEFLIVLADCNLDGAAARAETARERIASLTVPGVPMALSASFGVTTTVAGETISAAVARADAALLAAKAAGRNCVRIVAPGQSARSAGSPVGKRSSQVRKRQTPA